MQIRGMKLKQAFTLLIMCAVMTAASAKNVSAKEDGASGVETKVQEAAEYDLEEGGTQSFEIVDENGEETEIIIEEVPGIARVANGTYKITRNRKGCWTAGFYVDVKENRFVKAHDKFYKIIKGSIKDIRLSKESNIQATLTLRYNNGLTKISKIRAKISNRKLVVEVS